MSIYVRRFIILISIAGISSDICADVMYSMPRLDTARIERRREAIDTKHNRATYARYSVLAALTAGAACYGYNALTAIPEEVPTSGLAKAASLVANFFSQGKALEDHNKRLELLEGKSFTAWLGSIVKKGIFGITFKDILAYGGTPVVMRTVQPLFDIDALWYQISLEDDFVKGIAQKAKRFSPFERRMYGLDPLTSAEKAYLCHMIEDNMQALNKQVEKIIAFVWHKQGQYSTDYPMHSEKVDNQIRYLNVSYEAFVTKIEALLNDTAIADEVLSSEIIQQAQQFKDDYEQVKTRLKDLEDDLEAAKAMA